MKKYRVPGAFLLILLFHLLLSSCNDLPPFSSGEKKKEEVGKAEACSAPYPWTEKHEEMVRRIGEFFSEREKKGLFNGNVLVAEKGRIIYRESHGFRDRRSRDSLQVEDPFQLASTSKALTATIVLQLREEGKIRLEDSLSRFFDAWPYEGITVEMLLSHRSGLSNYMYFMEDWEVEKETYNNEDVLQVMKKDTPDPYYPPDHRYNYCNTNYCLLALILEKITEKDYQDLVRERIFQRLEGEIGRSDRFPDPQEALVKGHDKRGRRLSRYRNRVLGDKGVHATADELYAFDRALRNGILLSDSSLQEAYTPRHQDLYEKDNYGLGWRIDRSDPDDRVVWHNGWWKGFRTYFIRMLDRDATFIVLNNTTRGPFFSNEELITLLYPETVRRAR